MPNHIAFYMFTFASSSRNTCDKYINTHVDNAYQLYLNNNFCAVHIVPPLRHQLRILKRKAIISIVRFWKVVRKFVFFSCLNHRFWAISSSILLTNYTYDSLVFCIFYVFCYFHHHYLNVIFCGIDTAYKIFFSCNPNDIKKRLKAPNYFKSSQYHTCVLTDYSFCNFLCHIILLYSGI